MTGSDASADRRPLELPRPPEFRFTHGSFEIPGTTVRVNLRPHLLGEMLALVAEAVELGVDANWFRTEFQRVASTIVETASGREYLSDLVNLAERAQKHDLLSPTDLLAVHSWANEITAPPEPPAIMPVGLHDRWDQHREALQLWIDAIGDATRKRLLRQRSIARVTCDDCHSMLAWLVPQGDFEFLVLARGDVRAFEVGHAVGEYGGYVRTRCGRRKGGRLWVMHADHLRQWLDEGHADVGLRHVDKGL